MVSTLKSFGISSHFSLTKPLHSSSRTQYSYSSNVQCCATKDSTASSSSLASKVNGTSTVVDELSSAVKDVSNWVSETVVEIKDKVVGVEKLGALWDDGYGNETVKDYLDYAQDVIRPDGGPPRWFTPISCGPHLKDSPVLLFLPGVDGMGLGLCLHHKALGKVFDVRCMHIPVQDRTPFQGLVEWVEETVKTEHSASPKKPIYVVGDSFGGCLALAVAARNPKIDLVVILANPATSFARSQLQPLLPILEALPNDLHVTVPYLLSFVMGDPVKMATVGIDTMLPPAQYSEKLASNLTGLLPRLSGLADILPKDGLLWKLKLLRAGAAYANSRLHAIRAEVLILVSGKDNMLPSREEGQRLKRSIQNCKIRYFKDNGHTILLEDGVNLLTTIKGTFTYRRSRTRDYVRDYLPPSASEFKQVEANGWFRNYAGPAMFSTKEDGSIVRGLSGVPSEGPVLLVGYHMLMGLELYPLMEQFLREKKIMVRGIAHPSFFNQVTEDQNNEPSITDFLKLYGAVPVGGTTLFKLFASNSHVLLYPGGAREALHYKGEQYKLFWPDQPEFVRMAARFGATIVPFGVIGEDDLAELVLDYNDLMRIPILGGNIRRDNEKYRSLNVRAGMSGEVANQSLYIPGLLPKFPGRLYYLFGKPIPTKGRQDMLKDKDKAKELYMQIQSDVESNMSYLLKKRTEDPYRNVIDRTIYRAFNAPMDQVPSFEP